MKRFIPLLLPLALAACSPHSPADQAKTATSASTAPAVATTVASMTTDTAHAALLGKYHWQLTNANSASGEHIDALFANTDNPVQLDFASGTLAVSHTCNSMHGSYQLAGDKLTLGPMAQTMRACLDPKMAALDKAVGQVLHGTLTLSVKPDAQAPLLTLTDAAGDILLLRGHPTPETRFGSAGKTVFLEVAAQTVPCAHPVAGASQCLNVRERHFDANGLKVGTPGPWHALEQPIEGYTHQSGVRNVLRLKQFKRTDAPAGAASTAYVLDMVVESAVAH
ncbi:MAG TPA: META and DUF4377 domain-containing protein [Rhodanobacteraceae bacterium]